MRMGIAALMKTQWQAARLVGKKDYDGAIRLVESALSGSAEDASLLVLVAHCHYWAKREDMALISAQKALLLDPRSFEANKFLSGVYASREEYERAARHAKDGLENYPEPLPSVPKVFLLVVRVASALFPRLRRIDQTAQQDLADPNKDNKRWYAWATEYLRWYDAAHGSRTSPTVH
jgi:tetratricopeptide (TPR) repeat protein